MLTNKVRPEPLIYQLNLKGSKVKRFRKKSPVTLIVAFRHYEGALICADSQETLSVPTPDGYQAYSCQVSKIRVEFAREYDAVIGGAGDGALVDCFRDNLVDEIKSWDANLDTPTIKESLRQFVFDFHRNEVALSQSEDKNIAVIVCLKHRAAGKDPLLYEIRGSTVREVESYSMIGWEEGVYKHFIERLYKGPNDGKNRALLVALYVMLLAKSTSTQIGNPIKAILVTPNVIREEDHATIEEVERRIESFARILEDVALWCPDASVPNHEFPGYLANIEAQLMTLREKYFGPNDKTLVYLINPDLSDS